MIKIAEGVCVPDYNEAAIDFSFRIVEKTLTLQGGYDNSFSSIIGFTTLSGDVNGDDVYDESTGILTDNYIDNCDRVMTIATDANITLKNLIIKGGNADNSDKKLDTGGGMYIGATVVMENCVVTGNRCTNTAGGGGICFKGGSLTMTDCVLKGNSLEGDGGALYVKGDIPLVVKNCLFDSNLSTSGSAVFISNSTTCYFYGNTFVNNQSATYGTFTVYNKNYAQAPVLVNNTFANNKVSGNTAGKTLLGGAGVYMYMGKDAQLSMINNTVIGNSVEGTDAEGNVSGDLGGAIYGRQGNVLMANNIVAGNTSLSGYGDVYTLSGFGLISKDYNFFTGDDNMNVTPSRNDMVAAFYCTDGMSKLSSVFDGELSNGAFKANCVNNGGPTPTVKILDETIDFDGLTINSVPLANLTASSLGVDIFNTGSNEGVLNLDQRGAERNLEGHAYTGAFEKNSSFSKVDVISTNNGSLIVNGDYVVAAEIEGSAYTIFDMTGKELLTGTVDADGIYLGAFESGCYIVRVFDGKMTQTVKVLR